MQPWMCCAAGPSGHAKTGALAGNTGEHLSSESLKTCDKRRRTPSTPEASPLAGSMLKEASRLGSTETETMSNSGT